MAYVEDRWYHLTVNSRGRRVLGGKTDRHGHGKRYRVRYTDPSGRERSKSFDREDNAEAFRDTVAADMVRGNYIDLDAGKITLEKYGRERLASQGGEATTKELVRHRLEKHVFPALGDKALGHLAQRPSAIQAWLNNLPLAPTYKRVIFAHLSSILAAAVDDGLIPRNPCKVSSMKLPKLPRRDLIPWEAARVAAVREALPERYRGLVDVGAGLGLRQGEGFALAPRDVEWLAKEPRVHVCRQVRIVASQLCFAPPKGNRERRVPLPESVKGRLSAHLSAFPAVPVTLPWLEPGGKPVTEHLIFTTSARTAINRSYFDRALWKPALEYTGVIPARQEGHRPGDRQHGFHALRHCFASMVLAGGEDIKALAEYLGHSDAGFTLRVYAHLIPGHGERMRGTIDALLADTDGPAPAQVARKE